MIRATRGEGLGAWSRSCRWGSPVRCWCSLGDGVTGALSVALEAPVLGMVALPLLLVFAAIAAGWALFGVLCWSSGRSLVR